MKEYFSRQIGLQSFEFRRVCFPDRGTWYKIHVTGPEGGTTFWMKRGHSGRWKIQPQLLPEEVMQQESVFAKAISEQESVMINN